MNYGMARQQTNIKVSKFKLVVEVTPFPSEIKEFEIISLYHQPRPTLFQNILYLFPV